MYNVHVLVTGYSVDNCTILVCHVGHIDIPANNETAVLLVHQAKPVGHEVFSFVNAFFCLKKVEYNL